MRYNNTRRLERYSNGKEPHWKCGVPQGIVRSSRILSAKSIRFTDAFFFEFQWICPYETVRESLENKLPGTPPVPG